MKSTTPRFPLRGAGLVLLGAGLAMAASGATAEEYRRQLGKKSPKIKHDDDRTRVWAGGGAPGSDSAEYFDFTGSPIKAAELQFGIGKDRIRAIDDPVFVKPDDPRLLNRKYIALSPYRRKEKPKTNDDMRVIGWVHEGEARAYPIALLDGHELVNDRISGKPVTVGW